MMTTVSRIAVWPPGRSSNTTNASMALVFLFCCLSFKCYVPGIRAFDTNLPARLARPSSSSSSSSTTTSLLSSTSPNLYRCGRQSCQSSLSISSRLLSTTIGHDDTITELSNNDDDDGDDDGDDTAAIIVSPTASPLPQQEFSSSPPSSPSSLRRNRRQSLFIVMTSALAILPTTFVFPPTANAVMMDPNLQTTFEVGKDLTADQALERFQQGLASLEYLLKNYDTICQDNNGGGDNIRRYLGTVGVSSGLYGIGKVLKILARDAPPDIDLDVVEFSESSDELVAAINRADGSAYMSIFTTFSSSSVPPTKYLGDAKIEIQQALEIMQDLSHQLGLR